MNTLTVVVVELCQGSAAQQREAVKMYTNMLPSLLVYLVYFKYLDYYSRISRIH